MYGLDDTKLVHVRFWVWLVLLAHISLVSPNLRCYSSEQDRSIACDDEEAVCFTVCNRNITIQGCSWESCEALVSVFPHISDCLHCKEDNCNIVPCLNGKLVGPRNEKSNKQYIREKNSTRYKLLWPEQFERSTGKPVTIRDSSPRIRYTHQWKNSGSTSIGNPQTTQNSRDSITRTKNIYQWTSTKITSTDSPKTTSIENDPIDIPNENKNPNQTVSVNDQVPSKSVKADSDGSFNLGNKVDSVNDLELLLLLFLLLTLCLICLMSTCWMCMCRWVCQCHKIPSCTQNLTEIPKRCENDVDNNTYLECYNVDPRDELNPIETQDVDGFCSIDQGHRRGNRSNNITERSNFNSGSDERLEMTYQRVKNVENKRRGNRTVGKVDKSHKQQDYEKFSYQAYDSSSANDDFRTMDPGHSRKHRSNQRKGRSKMRDDNNSENSEEDEKRDPTVLERIDCMPEVYTCSSTTQDMLNIVIPSSKSYPQMLSDNAVTPVQNADHKLHKKLSKFPMASSMRFLLVPGYYLQGISVSTLQALASRYTGIREKAGGSDQNNQGVLDLEVEHRPRKNKSYALNYMKSSEELEVRYFHQFY